MTAPNRIPLCVPHLGGNEQKYVLECIETNFVSSVGPFVSRFEEEFARRVNSKYAVACASGTAAIHLALRILGVKENDEVWVPTFTFVATANPVLYQGARITFFDVESKTWNIDPELIADELKRRKQSNQPLPKAILPVHIYGHPAALNDIIALCAEHDIPVIEDATEALGAAYTAGPFVGRSVGTIGKIGCFSFNGNKIITSGGGGMLVTDDEAIAKKAKYLSTQARLPGLEYRHAELGYNYRMSNISAALGVAQLEQLDRFLQIKREIADRYNRALKEVPGIVGPPAQSWANSSRWMYSILVEKPGADARAIIRALDAAGIESRPLWSPLHEAAYFNAKLVSARNTAAQLFRTGISLPSSCGMTPKEQEFVISSLLSQLK